MATAIVGVVYDPKTLAIRRVIVPASVDGAITGASLSVGEAFTIVDRVEYDENPDPNWLAAQVPGAPPYVPPPPFVQYPDDAEDQSWLSRQIDTVKTWFTG